MTQLQYHTIAEDVRRRVIDEAKQKLAARRQFLEQIVRSAETNMAALDNERLQHFLAKHVAAAELRELEQTESELDAS